MFNNNSSGVHRPPAPIFNLSKRPRQALVSDPCESEPFAGHIVRNNRTYPGTNFGPSHSRGGQTGQWNSGNPQNSMRDPPKPNQRPPLIQNRLQTNPQVRSSTGTSGTSAVFKPNQFQNNTGQAMRYGQQENRRPSFGRGNQAANDHVRGPTPDTSQSGNRNFQKFKPTGNPPTRRPGFLDVGPKTQPRGANQFCSESTTRQTVSSSGHQGFSTQAYNRNQRQQSNLNKSYTQPAANKPSTEKSSNFHSNKPIQDKSLRVITSTIHSMKQWANTRDSIPLLFELYGIVDSAVTMNELTQGKEFMLKDETEVLSCVFFEIDRSLLRLTRGQWHRCMGAYNPRQERFKCVSVRPCNPAERGLAKTATKVCDQTMRSMASGLREI